MWLDTNDNNRSVAIYDNDGTEDDFYPFSCPVGMISAYGGSSAPAGWLLCDGTTGLSTTTNPEYTKLFAIIGTTYGGAGATDFDVPDLRGRVPIGLDASFVNVTTPTAGSLGETAAGEEDHTLTGSESPAHTHDTIGTSVHSVGTTRPSFSVGGSDDSDYPTDSFGGGNAHNNMQPYLTVNYIIKF